MANQLKNVVSFSGLVVGVPVSLAHGLNVNDDGVTPDEYLANEGGFTVTVDATNVTVTRLAAATSGDVDVLVKYWHTVGRQFGVSNPQPAALTGSPFGLVPTAPGGGGAGDVVGPAGATDSAIALYDGVTGKLLKNSVVIVDAAGNMTGVGTVACGQITTEASLFVKEQAAATADKPTYGQFWVNSANDNPWFTQEGGTDYPMVLGDSGGSIDNGIAVFNGVNGDELETTAVTVDASANMAGVNTLQVAAGLVGAPSIYLAAHNTTGIYQPAANEIGFTAAGTLAWKVDSSGNWVAGVRGNYLDVSGDLGETISSDGDDRIAYRAGGALVAAMDASTSRMIMASGFNMYLPDATELQLGTTPDAVIVWNTAQTNEALTIGVSDSRSVILCELADDGTDFGHAVSTNPTLYIQSSDSAVTADYLALYHNQVDAVLASGSGNVLVDIAGSGLDLNTKQLILDADQDTHISAAVEDVILFTTDGTPAWSIDASQNLVVSTRGYKLDVSGDAGEAIYSSGDGTIRFDCGGSGVFYCNDTQSSFAQDVRTNDDIYFVFGSSNYARIAWSTAQTVDGWLFGAGLNSNYLLFCERADMGFDFAHGAQTTPTLFIHSQNQSTTQWIGLTHDQNNGVVSTGAGNVTLSPAGTYATLGNDKYFGFGATPSAAIGWNTTQTQDALMIGVDSTSRIAYFCELADVASDIVTATNTNPQVRVYAASANATRYIAVDHDATNGNVRTGTGALALQPSTGVVYLEGSLFLKESSEKGNVAGYGQLYCVNNAGTTELWFSDDTGTDTQLAEEIAVGKTVTYTKRTLNDDIEGSVVWTILLVKKDATHTNLLERSFCEIRADSDSTDPESNKPASGHCLIKKAIDDGALTLQQGANLRDALGLLYDYCLTDYE